jgi:hypothetical protein
MSKDKSFAANQLFKDVSEQSQKIVSLYKAKSRFESRDSFPLVQSVNMVTSY